MKDLRAQDRGHAGMPRVPGSADGRQGRAEAEAERAGLNEGRGDLHDSVGAYVAVVGVLAALLFL